MKKRIGIVFGGNSVEHEISILSLIQASHAVNTNKYELLLIYLTKDGQFWVGPEFADLKTFQKDKFKHYPITFFKQNGELMIKGIGRLPRRYRGAVDVILPIVHGKNVEDGNLAGFFKIFNIPYASSDTFAASLFQDKYYTKKLLDIDGIRTLPYHFATIFDFKSKREDLLDEIEFLDYPVIIKPVSLGSSIGIKIADNREELKAGLKYAFKYEDRIIVERKLSNYREFNQAVLEKYGDYILSEIEEVKSENSFLSFSDKYLPATSTHQIPALIPIKLQAEISNFSHRIAKEYNIRGVIRIDYLYDQEERKVYVNEVNTIPGSLAFYLFEDQFDFTELIDLMIISALKSKYNDDLKVNSFKSMVLQSSRLLKK